MSGSWPVWIALVCLVLSHVFMFALGVAAYHGLRWINMKPMVGRPPAVNEAKLMQMADKIARQQAQAEQFAWLKRNQEVSRGGDPPQIEEAEESFSPSRK